MFRRLITRKSALLTITLGLGVLSSTIMPGAANAFGWGGGHSHGGGGYGGMHRPHPGPWGGGYGHRPYPGPWGGGYGHRPYRYPPVIVERPIYERPAPVMMAAPSGPPQAAAPAPCTCLTKQYQDDGSVVFRDLCTREAAVATAADLQAQQASVQQQAPAPAPAR